MSSPYLKLRRGNSLWVTHRRSEVVSHLVRHGDVGDGGRDRLAVVEQGDDARVQTLQAAAVMLKKKKKMKCITPEIVYRVTSYRVKSLIG